MANERILIVDDEPGVVHSCLRILKRRGFFVTGKTDSTVVPQLLKQETFDLLLSDIKMPGIDGLELLRQAKEIDPHLAVVLFTGYGTMEAAIRAIRLGAQGFLLKPFEPEELVAAIEDSLHRRDLLRDSLRLQTLLPLLEINHALQSSEGATALVQRILEIGREAIGAAQLSWRTHPVTELAPPGAPANLYELMEAAVVIDPGQQPFLIPEQAWRQVLDTAKPAWLLADGHWVEDRDLYPNIVGALLPLVVKGQIMGILSATAPARRNARPFGKISLELLSVLAGQLAIILENMQLFQQAEVLRGFNEDIIRQMTNGLIAVDTEGRITAFNPAASAMLGCPAEAVLHRPLSALRHAEALVNVFQTTLTRNQGQPRQEIIIERGDGQHLPIAISTALLGTERGSSARQGGVVGVVEDLSEIKALEAEHRRLDRLAALGEMSAVVAHEIRNPVAGIAAGIDYLTRQVSQDSPEAEGAAMIYGEIERVNRILEDILFVARPLHLDQTLQPVPPILETVLQRYQPKIRANAIIVSSRYDDELPHLNVDAQRLEQVFSNLILNAIQAMPTGGQLTIQARRDRAADLTPAGILISITDTGAGIAADVQKRIFDPFFTTKTKGTGLGLSVARRIVEAHGGVIALESAVKQGTTLIVHLFAQESNGPYRDDNEGMRMGGATPQAPRPTGLFSEEGSRCDS